MSDWDVVAVSRRTAPSAERVRGVSVGLSAPTRWSQRLGQDLAVAHVAYAAGNENQGVVDG